MKTFLGFEAPLSLSDGTACLLDVVVHLGREKRFNNAGDTTWSVLHHSVFVALLWVRAGYPIDEVHHALLHDAHEFVLGDTSGPVKEMLRRLGGGPLNPMPDYLDPMKKLEGLVDARIRHAVGRLGAPDDTTKRRIKICDLAALVVEGVFFGAPGCDCSVDVPPAMMDEVYNLIALALPGIAEAADRLLKDPAPLLPRARTA